MSLCNTFVELYDKAQRPEFAAYHTSYGYFEVKECDTGASVTRLRVTMPNAEFSSFNNHLVKGMKEITEIRSSRLLDSDCDGIAFVNYNGHDGLVLAELKSRFSTMHLKKAFGQLTHSFLKMHAMLSLCKDYSIDTISLHFIVACQCFSDNNQEDSVYNLLSKAENSDSASFEGKLLRKLLEQHHLEVPFGTLTSLWNMPLNSSLIEKPLTLSLQLTQHFGDSTLEYCCNRG